MKQILEKITHLVTDVQKELISSENALIFFKGYLQALVDINVIDNIEKKYYFDFAQSLLIRICLHESKTKFAD